MNSGEELTITLPSHLADMVKAMVVSGEFATESDVIRNSLLALFEREHSSIEQWLSQEIAPAFDALKAAPSTALDVHAVRANLADAHLAACAGK